MRKLVLLVLTIAILGIGLSASAQVPFVQVYFDPWGTQGGTDCPAAMGIAQVSVFACNFNMWMAAIEYMIDYSPALTFLGDIIDPDALAIGNSAAGIAISYPIPGNAWGPFRTQEASVWWNCDDCTVWENTVVVVLPHPSSGRLRAVQWPDLTIVDGVGMTSFICQEPIPVRDSTWGSVKSLYNH